MEWWLRRTHALCRMTFCGGCRLVAVDFAICVPPGIPAWWLQAGGRWLLCVGGSPLDPPCPDLACEVARATTIYTPRFLPAPSSIKSTKAEMKSSSSGRPTKPSPASRKKSLAAIRQGG